MKVAVLLDVTTCSITDLNRRFSEPTASIIEGRQKSCVACSNTLTMQYIGSSETSVTTYENGRHTPEDSNLHNQDRENFKSHT
jgi:hypothetical protein